MGRRGDQRNPNSIGVFIPSRVRISRALKHASTHSRISRPQHASDGAGLGGFAHRRAALTPAPALGHQPVCVWVGRCQASPAVRVRCAARPSSAWAVRDPTGAPSSPRELRRPQTACEASARRCALITASRAVSGPHPNRPRAVGFAPQMASHAGILTDPKCYKPEMRGSLRRAVDAGGASAPGVNQPPHVPKPRAQKCARQTTLLYRKL